MGDLGWDGLERRLPEGERSIGLVDGVRGLEAANGNDPEDMTQQ